MTKANEPAFPYYHNIDYWGSGLSKREYFAAKAMQGILSANAPAMEEVNDKNVDYVVAREAVASADALLAELEKGEKE